MVTQVCAYGYVTREWEVLPNGEKREITAGPPYFFAYALAMLGDKVTVVTRVAKEDVGILEELTKLGIKVVNLPTQDTMKSLILYKPDGSRELEVLSLAKPFSVEELELCFMERPRYIYLGPLTTRDFDIDFLKKARSRSMVVLDVQGFTRKVAGKRVVYVDWDWKYEAAPYINILKLDDVEGRLLTGFSTPEDIIGELHDMGFSEILLTTSQGVYASIRNRDVYEAPYKVSKVVGRTGRGDTATAAYLHAKLRRWSIDKAVKFVAAATSLKLMEVGPLRRSESEILRFMEENY